MTINELNETINALENSLYLSAYEKELLHLAERMLVILTMSYYEAPENEPLVARVSVRNAIRQAAEPLYKERTER